MPRLMRRMRHGSIATGTLGLVAAWLFLIAHPAAASVEYPALVKSYWGVNKLPVTGADGCPLCHTTDPGMLGTANQKFAITLKGFGLQAQSDNALKAALDKSKSKMTDSDGDGFSDYEEIVVDGTNPNNAGDHAAPMPVETGGSGTVAGSPDGVGVSPDAGAGPDAVGAGGTDAGTADGSLAPCTTTETIYPTLTHGCSIGSSSTFGVWWSMFGVAAVCAGRRARRAPRRSRKLA